MVSGRRLDTKCHGYKREFWLLVVFLQCRSTQYFGGLRSRLPNVANAEQVNACDDDRDCDDVANHKENCPDKANAD